MNQRLKSLLQSRLLVIVEKRVSSRGIYISKCGTDNDGPLIFFLMDSLKDVKNNNNNNNNGGPTGG